ncbi:MAG: class I tRNA ligase family protein [bacterium]
MKYDHAGIEKKWQEKWEKAELYKTSDSSDKPKKYILVEFPYPSGVGLHVGHPRSYIALDAVARKSRMEGNNVLFPIGYDAFGLPAENYAIKTGVHPSITTQENITTFRRQLKSMGFSFDYSREVNTTDPKYYRWTQWMFLELFKAGLAYKAKININWCPKDKIGLANEEVVGGECERCGTPVEKREKEQWMIAITKYAERLLEDLKTVDYLPKIKKAQEEWIGRSEGAEIDFACKPGIGCHPEAEGSSITVFTTRPDTLWGVTYVVLAPEHPMVSKLTSSEHRAEVEKYVTDSAKKSEADRGDDTKIKTGVFTGSYAVNPVNGDVVPIWVADYVLGGYGTGAVMAVPEHDERDHEFAEKYNLPIIDRPLVAFDEAVAKAHGRKTIKYKLRDWVFSRQRYWGEPIPLIHCESGCSPETGGWVAVPEKDLPVVLPQVEKYQPTDNGDSPLAVIESFVNTKCPECGGKGKRETDTMPNWAGSSWYFLRYIDPKNDAAFADKEKMKHWMPVDLYNGGMEHVTLHLLYSRFWNKFLFDRGHVPTSEPYNRRVSHGLIMSSDGTKMSKSKGNVVNPDGIVKQYGADVFRMYTLFMGPFAESVPWSENGLVGVERFVEKIERYVDVWGQEINKSINQKISNTTTETPVVIPKPRDLENEKTSKIIEKTIKKVGDDLDGMNFNTAISALMIMFNELAKLPMPTKSELERVLRMLAPIAPHLASELWERIGNSGFVESEAWPIARAEFLVDETVKIAVQVNGKLRGTMEVKSGASEDEVLELAKAEKSISAHLEGKKITKVILVPNRLLNIVVE